MKSIFLAIISCVLLSGCGGGGNSSAPPITITSPDLYETGQYPYILTGQSFVPPGSTCYTNQTIQFRDIPGRYSISWENQANGASGTAAIWNFCEPEISWAVIQGVPLASGENQITVTLTTDDATFQDTILVTSLYDAAPTVIAVLPEDLSSGSCDGFISLTFSEQIDPYSLWDNFTVRNTTTNNIVTGEGSMDSLAPTFQPNPALDANTTYVVRVEGVQDLAGNIMREPYEWSFTTGF
jgi:Bacterial Ig-like domain